MSDHTPFGFGKFIPGFDFLQNLSKAGQAAPGIPSMSHWVAPTVSVEEISKRIEELKAVQFWLEQNSRALTATVQALEVQKMTLSTLQGMNVSMADLAKNFTGAAAQSAQAMKATQAAATEAASHAGWPMSSAPKNKKNAAATADAARAEAASDSTQSKASEVPPQAEKPAGAEHKTQAQSESAADSAAAGLGDPMLWWGALTQQFQQIAATAMQDPAQQQAMSQATSMASDFTKAAMNAASSMVRQASDGVKTAANAAAPTKAAKPAEPGKTAKAATTKPAATEPAATAPKAAPRKPAAKKSASAAAPKPATKKTAPARKRSV